MKNKQYSLFNTIGMIVGIVIGSGIFFKSDNILISTNGNIGIGILFFCIAALSIVFGSLSISSLASKNSNTGGIIAYSEIFSKYAACAIGWFHTFLYYPTLIAVVSWIAGVYTLLLFGINSSLVIEVLIGLLIVIIFYLLNIISMKLGSYFQNISTIIKIISLIVIAICGLIWGNLSDITLTPIKEISTLNIIAAIAPIAFSFDGWIIATTISHEIRNPKKNLPIALVISPIIILTLYVLYFVGISIYIGPEKVMMLGDSHVAYAANKLLGNFGEKIILTFIIISILGTINGIIIGFLRLPNALAQRNMFPFSNKFKKINNNLGISINSAIFTFALSLLWIFINYLSQKYNLLGNSDISEISISFNYIAYIYVYINIIKLSINSKNPNRIKDFLFPFLAIIGSLLVVFGSFTNNLIIYYSIFCLLIIFSSIIYYKKHNN